MCQLQGTDRLQRVLHQLHISTRRKPCTHRGYVHRHHNHNPHMRHTDSSRNKGISTHTAQNRDILAQQHCNPLALHNTINHTLKLQWAIIPSYHRDRNHTASLLEGYNMSRTGDSLQVLHQRIQPVATDAAPTVPAPTHQRQQNCRLGGATG